MPRYFLGVDTGATKSHALIADESGRAIGFGEAGPGNPEGIGYTALADVLRSITSQAVSRAGIGIEQIADDWPSQREVTLSAIHPLGLRAPLEVVNDTIVGLLAGAPEGWGVAVVAGTGCNCRGRDRQRREGRMTGFGWGSRG
jgi:N-acetylglucosamine kinase-like BadF-type ATPase